MAGTNLWSFLVAILVLVTIHEFGHYWVAKRCGVEIEKFSIGFGPTVLTWSNKEGTQFVLAAIPLGGFVKMKGEYAIATSEQQTSQGAGSFAACSVWQRMAIVAAGPLVNLIFAAVVFAGLFYGHKESIAPNLAAPTAQTLAANLGLKAGDVIESINGLPVRGWGDIETELRYAVFDHEAVNLTWRSADGMVQKGMFETKSLNIENPEWVENIGLKPESIQPYVGALMDGAGKEAGLQQGDTLMQVNGQPITDSQMLIESIQKSADKPLTLQIKRSGQNLNVTAKPKAEQNAGEKVGKIGVVIASSPVVLYENSMFTALKYGVRTTVKMAWLNTKGLFKIITGQMSLKNIGGPVAISKATGEGAKHGIQSFLWVLAVISVSLGALNLLPIPVLDGGHLVYYAFEIIIGRPVSERALAIGQRVGLALLLSFMGIAFFNDAQSLFG